ncbi:MAG: FAD-dependent oxidoreductase, partial [Lentilitoribacter sp.]
MTFEGSDAIVIGGGLHGLSSALHLARKGLKVTLLEQSYIGRHASGGSAAGVRTLNRAFEELPIAFEAMDMWHNMEAFIGDDCGFHADGQIMIAQKSSELNILETRLKASRANGFDHEELIDGAELRRLVPNLNANYKGALIVRDDGAADPHRTIRAFQRNAEKAGVVIKQGHRVSRAKRVGSDWVLTADGAKFSAPFIINAAGAWASQVASLFGDDIVLGHKASMMIVTERVAPLLKPVISLAGQKLSFKQTDKGTLLIGGGRQGWADVKAQKSSVNFQELAKSVSAAAELFPIIKSVQIVRTWAGIEAKTEDLLPVIGASFTADGVYHAFGFSGH